MKEHVINLKNSFILGWFIDHKICDDLIALYNSNSDRWEAGVTNTGVVDQSIKDSTDLHLNIEELMTLEYSSVIRSCFNLYVEKWKISSLIEVLPIEGMNIQKYPAGGGFKVWHYERDRSTAPNCNRHLVFMTYLNDVEEGGETEFAHFPVRIKPEKGLTLMWPADWTHTHRGIVAPNEEKIIATGWLHMTNTDGD